MPTSSKTRSIPPEDQDVQHPYAAVYVLLLSWEHDDLGVDVEIDQLAIVFRQAYGFQVEQYLVPSTEPDQAFAEALNGFVKRHQNPRTLLIVYYGGHGSLNDARLAIWHCSKEEDSPILKWYSHQRVLEDSTADVLLLLDCCQPLGGGGSVRAATSKQVLAAAGFGTEAPGVGEHSFSRALIEELLLLTLRPFTVSTLHHRVVNRLRASVPTYRGEQRETPVCMILGEGGDSNSSIRIVSYAAFPINLIVLMGATGSGKSSLINRICNEEVAEVGEGQESVTQEVTHYIKVVNGQTITLIDTPGFDDTYLSDREVLEKISTYLFQYYRSGRKLSGLLYLRDINISRMTHTGVKNIDMFQRLCGEESLRNVILLTTRWDEVDYGLGQRREEEITSKFWNNMIKLGSTRPKRLGAVSSRSLGTVDPISDVITPMLRFQPTFLQIQRELGDGKNLIDTAAGQYIDRDLSAAIAEYSEILQSLQATNEAQGEALEAVLEEQAETNKQQLETAKKDQNALNEDFQKIMEAEEERRSKLFGFNFLSSLNTYVEDLDSEGKNFKLWAIGIPSIGLFQACKYVWKKKGVSMDLIESAKKSMKTISLQDY